MIALKDYAKVKNNYCICYFGHADEYLVQLRLIKSHLEQTFPGLNIYLGCKDEKTHYFGETKEVLKISELKKRKNEFAYIREIRFNGNTHPIEDLLAETGTQIPVINTEVNSKTVKAVIFTEGIYPTKSLLENDVKKFKDIARNKGFEVEVNTNIQNAGLVMGVECAPLFEAASQGIKTILSSTGIGVRLYKTFFPNAEVVA